MTPLQHWVAEMKELGIRGCRSKCAEDSNGNL